MVSMVTAMTLLSPWHEPLVTKTLYSPIAVASNDAVLAPGIGVPSAIHW